MGVYFIDLTPQVVVTFSGIRDVKKEIVKFRENFKEITNKYIYGSSVFKSVQSQGHRFNLFHGVRVI